MLDLACGTGTLTALLAQRGYDVIGADASPEMLAVASEKLAAAGADAVLLCQKMEELDLYGTIDAAVCTLDSLNHITDEAAFREALRRAALFMNDGGVFLFDVNTPYKHEHVLGDNTFVYDLDEVFCVWQNAYDPETKTTDVTLDLIVYDEENDCYDRATEQFSERAYDLADIRRWLEENRFEVLCVLDEAGRRPVKDNDERALFVCKKHGTQFQ
ncbi:MAG: methyltransferase domain-containing protein [Clostridia bacterium]|nr:methyltransferase domain-containing protein [Clostridia bacterium]